MRSILLIIVLLSVGVNSSTAQESTRADSSSTEEDIAVYTMTGIIVPLALAGTAVSVVPPGFSTIIRDGKAYGAINLESGIGFGEQRGAGIYSDWRIDLSYTYVVNNDIRDPFRIELKREFHLDFIDRRHIVLPGLHMSAGLMTDFPNEGYTLGTGAWVKTPWLAYFGFFPQHTYGLTYRYNAFFNGGHFHEVTLGVTSAFTF